MGKFTMVSQDAFDALQLEAGVLLSKFDPENPVEPASEDIIATTTGGINPTCVPAVENLADDVDNVKSGMLDFDNIKEWTCTMSFTSIKINAEGAAWALGAADIVDGKGYRKIVPRMSLKRTDYKDIWWVGDKANGGAFAVRLINAISTGGLNIQSTKSGKGTSQVTLTGKVSLSAQNVVPMEFYDIDPDGAVTMYTVTQNLTHVTSDYSEARIEQNGNLTVQLTAEEDYELKDSAVTVHMGGIDITSTAYKGDDSTGGTVTINGVTGTVVITATGEYSPED